MDTFLRLCVVVLVINLAACAFWPDAKFAKFASEKTNPTVCITDKYKFAKDCALFTMKDLGDLSFDAGGFKLGTAYAALGIAIATAVNIAFDGAANDLRMLWLLRRAVW